MTSIWYLDEGINANGGNPPVRPISIETVQSCPVPHFHCYLVLVLLERCPPGFSIPWAIDYVASPSSSYHRAIKL